MLENRQTFQLNPEQITIRNILNNKSFIEVEIDAISNADPNRNRSCFTIESMNKGIKTFVDKPILGFFNLEGDFEQHNAKVSYDPELDQQYWDNTNGEQILGFIREKDRKEIVEKDGLTWIRCTAMIYTQYNFKQVKRLLKDKNKKVSVEVDIKKSKTINGIQYIYDFVLLGITILGSKGGVPIREGIAGAHLSVLDLMGQEPLHKQKEALVFAYAGLNQEEDQNKMAKAGEGTENILSVNKSKNALSFTEWSEVDKSAFNQQIVEASNFKEIAKEVYLALQEGWEEGDASKMKYPVMQFNDNGEIVYNRGSLALAKGYAEKNNDTEVLDKLKAIYAELDLNFDEEPSCDCSIFCALYEDEEPDNDDGDNDDDDQGKKGKGEGEEGDDGNKTSEPDTNATPDTNCNFEEKCKELTMQCEAYETRCAEYETRCADYETQCSQYEQRCKDYTEQLETCQNQLAAVNTELQAYKDKDKVRIATEQLNYVSALAQKMGFSQEDVKPLEEKCTNGLFTSTEEIEKEMAYISWKKKFAETKITKPEGYSVNIVDDTTRVQPRNTLTVSQRLKQNINNQ